MNIHFTDLLKYGFRDVSYEQNGLAFRKILPGNLLEICLYRTDKYLRLQTVRSGFTQKLSGINSVEDLKVFWKSITGEDLIEEAQYGSDNRYPQRIIDL